MQLVCPHCQRQFAYSGDRPSFCGFCGKPLPEPTQDNTVLEETRAAIPTTEAAESDPEAVGGYRLIRRLGAGGMGSVFEAEENATGRRVALKLIAPEFTESKGAVERFRQEGRLASAIAHPRCVFVLAADEDAGRPYIVMELMTGATLKDLVEKRGPLPSEEAVAKILDVIDGLREAHRLGVIHRDVKPSNCFLEAPLTPTPLPPGGERGWGEGGRVKVGDFGLSKSLTGDAHLTLSGAFLGTPFFASPEQIRRDPVDPQTDIYSTAATLYYLLTGRAPHETNDAAATMARIVADPAPPVRSLRPDISPALDRVIQRGLERQRERRWRSLDEFRAALLPFAPGRLSIGGMGIRLGAYLIDYLLLLVVTGGLFFLLTWWTGHTTPRPEGGISSGQVWSNLLGVVVDILYFTLLEGFWGCSLGKWLLRLRVCTVKGSDPPGLVRALGRTVVTDLMVNLGSVPFVVAAFVLGLSESPWQDPQRVGCTFMILGLLFWPLTAVGIGILVSTMRARNGYRGLHEFLSGTRVVSLPPAERQQTLPNRLEADLSRPDGLPEQVGPYRVRGAMQGTAERGVLLGEDSSLGRKVVIWFRPVDTAPALEPARREVGRPTRWRWLSGGKDGSRQWDALLASAGCSLPALVGGMGRLAWTDARPILEQLADEVSAACADGTLPESLAVDQVWVRSDGGAQLLDMPLGARADDRADQESGQSDPERALTLVRQAAVLALEGAPRPDGNVNPPIRAPLPGHAARCLNRLLDRSCKHVDQFRADLAATRDRPGEVTRARRFGHLATLTAFLLVGLCCFMLPATSAPGIVVTLLNTFSTLEAEEAQRKLEAVAASDLAGSGAQPNPFLRIRTVLQYQEDMALRDQLQRKLDRDRRERQAYLQSLGWGTRQWVLEAEHSFKRGQAVEQRWPEGSRPRAYPRSSARRIVESPPRISGFAAEFSIALLVMLVTWPVLWVIWAFLVRGGLSLRLVGLALVRSDGRSASRLQCAWRALMIWVPVTALLVVSTWLEVRYWSNWNLDEPMANRWLLWLSSASWWSAFGLLAVYFVLALWSPARALHDRLAGTYLVPR